MSDVQVADNFVGEAVDWDNDIDESPIEMEDSNEEIEMEDSSSEGEDSSVSDELSGDSEVESDESDNDLSAESEQPESEADSEDAEEGEEVEASEVEEISLESLQKQLEEGTYSLDIDGEQVSLQDIKNDYIGQKEVARRFTDLDKERKEYQSEVGEVEAYIGEFANKMQNGDVVGAFSYFGQFADIPPYMIKEQLIAALSPEIQRRSEMSAEQLQNEQLNDQNKYLQERNESEAKRKESEQANVELTNSINSIREAQGISETEWSEAVSYLQENVEDQSQLTPETVASYVSNVKAYDTAETILSSMEIPLDGNDAFVDTFQQIILDNPDFSEEDLRSLVEQSKTEKQKESVKTELKEKLAKGPKKEKKPVKKQEAKVEMSSYDDEDEWDNL